MAKHKTVDAAAAIAEALVEQTVPETVPETVAEAVPEVEVEAVPMCACGIPVEAHFNKGTFMKCADAKRFHELVTLAQDELTSVSADLEELQSQEKLLIERRVRIQNALADLMGTRKVLGKSETSNDSGTSKGTSRTKYAALPNIPVSDSLRDAYRVIVALTHEKGFATCAEVASELGQKMSRTNSQIWRLKDDQVVSVVA